MDHADTKLETCFKPLYDHVRRTTIGLRLTNDTYTEIFTGSRNLAQPNAKKATSLTLHIRRAFKKQPNSHRDGDNHRANKYF
ncbi:MAG: hypothetical protein ACJAVI_005665 [Candidatus Azotimanducaceae bacterium]|jgi:hypothetical protein